MGANLHHKASDALDAKSRAFSVWGIALGVAALAAIAGAGALAAFAGKYEGRIAPNISIGSVDVSGMDSERARSIAQKRADELLTHGVSVELADEAKSLPLSSLSGADAVDDARFEIADAVSAAMAANKADHSIMSGARMLIGLKNRTVIPVRISLNHENILHSLGTLFPDAQAPEENARLEFTRSGGAWTASVVPGRAGTRWDDGRLFTELETRLSRLESATFILRLVDREPEVSEEEAEATKELALAALGRAPYTISYTDVRGYVRKWNLTATELADMLLPSGRANAPLALDEEAFDAKMNSIAEFVEREAQNARFEMVDGRVREFAESKPGIAIDREAMRAALLTALADDVSTEIALATVETVPEVETGDANDLGVTQILGTGTSSYRGSPANRIRNIRNGVRLLNGRLIAPGETFSLTGALRPFTFENGYLPELVIKGTKIEPELGGGLCQIGTTTFRATMNSGLPVTERRNHSLVVSYYNDPGNGNPGTDATIYEPAPDYKFTNDTASHILFQAEMLEDIQQLRFTFWGTSDGRRGSYEPPVVHRWIPVGPTQYVETEDLEPGKEKCQEAHVGADASFTYTVVKPDGSVAERVFESHYRPLPRICLVGPVIEEETEDGTADEMTDITATE